MKELKVRLTFIEDILGTKSNNKDIYSDYIANQVLDPKKKKEEIEAVGIETYEEKNITVFPRMEDGTPVFWDYQIKGFFKEACSVLQRCKGEKFSKESCKLKAYKKIIDGCIFVEPRMIPIDTKGTEVNILQRPLRANTPQGERVALAISETVSSGSTIDITVICLSDDYEKCVREWLDYGRWKGLGQWRNASYGRFTYEII